MYKKSTSVRRNSQSACMSTATCADNVSLSPIRSSCTLMVSCTTVKTSHASGTYWYTKFSETHAHSYLGWNLWNALHIPKHGCRFSAARLAVTSTGARSPGALNVHRKIPEGTSRQGHLLLIKEKHALYISIHHGTKHCTQHPHSVNRCAAFC